ncbi:hypothetical protein O6H91_02G026200 [Diphasiastrum complanatum]|uniref:Uncharacterized protein n=1 Tax=Diphasiastrum complanatum TaxID=34168 RepID=A0ACC2EE29_DIPCM|nr:hypothetical protein O6H91_02G026200 [Diphasiastrum complanatum]
MQKLLFPVHSIPVDDKHISWSPMSITKWSMYICAMTMIFLVTSMLSVSASNGTSLLKVFFLILEPRMWQGAMQFPTQPVLFLLVNLVILLIWVSSDASYNAVPDLMKEETLASMWTAAKDKSQRGFSSWVSSDASYNAVPDLMKEETLASMWIAAKDKSQRGFSSCKQSITAASFCSSSPQTDKSHSKVLSTSATFPSSRVYAEVKSSQIECSISSLQDESKGEVSAATFEAKSTSNIEQKGPYSASTNLTRRHHASNKTTLHIDAQIKKSRASSPDLGASPTTRTKFENRSASFPEFPSRVIVRDTSIGEADSDKSGMSCCRPEVIVMEKDELNERIEAFFAKFREQLRRESLYGQ